MIRVRNTDHGPGPSLARWNKYLLSTIYVPGTMFTITGAKYLDFAILS